MITEGILPDSVGAEARDIMQARLSALNTIKQNLQFGQERMKKYADKHHSERDLVVDDMAYLKLQPYHHASLGIHKSIKLHSKFYGPFKVLQKIGKVAYKLLLPDDCNIHLVFHVSQLKRHIGPKVIPQADLPLTDADGNIKMSLEKLLDRRMIPRNNAPVVQWLIKWLNLLEMATTWEDMDFMRRVFSDFNP
jgi:hypothetical protein